jgi:hypothetical protein
MAFNRSGLQLIEQRLGLLQIERVETLGKPPIDRSEQFASLLWLTLIPQEPHHAHRRAQLKTPRFCCCAMAMAVRKASSTGQMSSEPDAHYLRSRRAKGFAKTATSTSLPVKLEPITLIFNVSFFGE